MIEKATMKYHFLTYSKFATVCLCYVHSMKKCTTNMFNSPNLYARDQIIASFEGEEVRL